MVIADFEIGVPELQHTIRELDPASIEVVDLQTDSRRQTQLILCVTGSEGAHVSNTVREDPTTIEASVLEQGSHRTLLAVAFEPDTPSSRAYATLIDLEGVLLQAVAFGHHWHVRIYLPSEDSAARFFNRLVELDLTPEFESIHLEHGPCNFHSRIDLTTRQREALILAARQGYFAVPRDASLSQVASDLGISEQALSERIRRGVGSLVEQTVFDERLDLTEQG